MHRARLRASSLLLVLLCTLLGLAVPVQNGPLWAASLGLMIGLLAGAIHLWRTPAWQVRRLRRDGQMADEDVRLEADDQGVTVERPGRRDWSPWSAFERVAPRSKHVFLHLSALQAIAVPRAAIGDRAAQANFVAQARQWLGQDDPAELPEGVEEPGRGERVLRFRLVVDDYVLLSLAARSRQLGQQPRNLTIMAALVGGTLLVRAEPWRAGVDTGVVALMVVFAAGLVVAGLVPLWFPRLLVPWLVRRSLRRSPGIMPLGAIVLGVGPDGGVVRSVRGTSRFAWSEIRWVHSDADLVLLMFSDLEGFVVPSRAFARHADQDAFVADVEAWREGHAVSGAPAPFVREEPVRPPVTGPPRLENPFEPPDGGSQR